MHEVSRALHRYATETDHTTTPTSASQQYSQPIHAHDNDTRAAYLDALHTPVQMQAFLNTEALRLASAFEAYNGTLTCTPVHTRVECLDDKDNVLHTCTTCIDANTKFTCVGRKSDDIRTPAFACHVSRYHVLVAHVTFAAEGVPTSRYLVFIDYWSHGGTAFAQPQQPQQSQSSATSPHASLPDARRVLMTRVTPATPVTLLLGNLSLSDEQAHNAFAPPLRVRFTVEEDEGIRTQPNLRTCVICMDASRTEVFTACSHLVTCQACCQTLLQKKQGCPLCKQPVTGVRSATKNDTATFCD